jgi:hypothetical protein
VILNVENGGVNTNLFGCPITTVKTRGFFNEISGCITARVDDPLPVPSPYPALGIAWVLVAAPNELVRVFG